MNCFNIDRVDILTKELQANLCKGSFVKLRFSSNDLAECMWVRITDIDGTECAGILSNVPIIIQGINAGDRIQFGTENIIDIYLPN